MPVARRIAFGERAHDVQEFLARELRIGIRAANEVEESRLGPFRRGDFGNDLLREDIERFLRNQNAVELAALHRIEQRRAFDELVARQREQPRLGHSADLMARAPRALQERRDGARRAQLADELDIADVDAKLKRRGRDQHLELAILEALLGFMTQLLRHAAVMRHHVLDADELGQVARGALGHAAGVDEDERGTVLVARARQAARRPAPTPRATSRLRAVRRALRAPGRAPEHDPSRRSRIAGSSSPGLLCAACRPGSARFRRSVSGSPKARCAAVRVRSRAASRSSDSARWLPRLLPARAWISSTITVRVVASILRPDSDPSSTYNDSGVVTTICGGRLRMPARSDCGVSPVRTSVLISTSGKPSFASSSRIPASGVGKIALDVVGQRLQRRHVHNERLVRKRRRNAVSNEAVDGGEKRRKGLAGAGGRGDQHVATPSDQRPRLRLRGGGRGEMPIEPLPYSRMKLSRMKLRALAHRTK